MAKDAYQLKGQNGGVVLTDGESWAMATTGALAGVPLAWVSVKEDTVLTSYAGNLSGGDTKLVGPTLANGQFIEGQTTQITVLTGLVVGTY